MRGYCSSCVIENEENGTVMELSVTALLLALVRGSKSNQYEEKS